MLVFFDVFLDKESEKNIRITLSCLDFDLYKNLIFMHKIFCPKHKISKKENYTFLVKTNDFSWFLVLKYTRNDQKNVHKELFLEKKNFIFYCFPKIATSCTEKSRRDGAKQMSDSDSAAKKHRKWSYLKIRN